MITRYPIFNAPISTEKNQRQNGNTADSAGKMRYPRMWADLNILSTGFNIKTKATFSMLTAHTQKQNKKCITQLLALFISAHACKSFTARRKDSEMNHHSLE